jgi:hypothetical protein
MVRELRMDRTKVAAELVRLARRVLGQDVEYLSKEVKEQFGDMVADGAFGTPKVSARVISGRGSVTDIRLPNSVQASIPVADFYRELDLKQDLKAFGNLTQTLKEAFRMAGMARMRVKFPADVEDVGEVTLSGVAVPSFSGSKLTLKMSDLEFVDWDEAKSMAADRLPEYEKPEHD